MFQSSKAVSNTINGARAIATQSIHILIINTTATAISGIHIASICHNDKAAFNNAAKVQASDGITPTEFIKEEYNAVKTHT